MLNRAMPPPLPDANPSREQVLYPKSKKYIVMSVLALAGGILASRLGANGIGWVSFGTIAFLWIQFKSSSITLDDEGFTHKSLGRRHTYKWAEIKAADGFFVVTQTVNFIKVNSFVGWNFDSSYRKARVVRAFSGMMMGTEAMIDPLGHDAKELALRMTALLRQAHSRVGPVTQVIA